MSNKESINHRIPDDVQQAWHAFQQAAPEHIEAMRTAWEQLRDSYVFNEKREYTKDDQGNFVKK